MNIFWYSLVGILLLVWFLGFIVFGAGIIIHFVFLLAVIVLIYVLYKENKTK